MDQTVPPDITPGLSAEDEAFLTRVLPLAEAELTALVARQEASIQRKQEMIARLQASTDGLSVVIEQARRVLNKS